MKSVKVDSVVQSVGQRITAFARWFRAKIVAAKHAVLTRVLLAGVCVLCVAAAGAADEPAGSAEGPGNGVFSRKNVSPEATWQAIRPRLAQAERDSAKAVESELAAINEFFAERKEGARSFAEAVLGFEGKLRAAGGIAEGMVGAVGEFFGSKPSRGPDSFTLYVQRSFREHVLDARELQKAIDASVTGYAREVKRIEAKLLVGLRADLDFSAAWPEIRAGREAAGQSDAMIAQARDAAVNDLVVEIGKQAVSCVIGNAITGQLTSDDDSTFKKGVVNLGAGLAVDKALDAGMARAGYNPEGALAAKIASSLDRMRDLVINGDPKASALLPLPLRPLSYSEFKRYWTLRAANQGLRQRLLSIHTERSRLREAALRRMVFDPGASR
jgi:hypothetical protein